MSVIKNPFRSVRAVYTAAELTAASGGSGSKIETWQLTTNVKKATQTHTASGFGFQNKTSNAWCALISNANATTTLLI